VPIVRAVRRDLDVGLIARLLATMLDAGVPLVDALDVAERAVPDGRSRDHVRGAREALQQGRSALDEDGLGPLLDIAESEILAVAERTGLLAEQWRRVAQRRATSLEERITRLGSALEPLLVVIVGLVVGGAVVALYLPTFRVLELL
jgi:type IV pilus assembly protein PilC